MSIQRENLSQGSGGGHDSPEQIAQRERIFRQSDEQIEVGHTQCGSDVDERSKGIRAMDALIGGMIGLVACLIVGLVVFRRGHFSEFRISLFVGLLVGGTLIGIIGSWLKGTKFWANVFDSLMRK